MPANFIPVLRWQNFVLCCAGASVRESPAYVDPERHYTRPEGVHCGQFKLEQALGARCDPRTFPWSPPLVIVDLGGKMIADPATCVAQNVDPDELEKTINEVLNLNCEQLKFYRRKAAERITHEFKWAVREALARMKANTAMRQQLQQYEEMSAGTVLAPDEHGYLDSYWTTLRQYLEDWAERWIAQNSQLLAVPAPPRPAAR